MDTQRLKKSDTNAQEFTPSAGLEDIDRAISGARIILRRNWRTMAMGASVAILTALPFTVFKSPEFTATVQILPYRNNDRAGELSGLVGLAGIRLPITTGEQTIDIDVYPRLVNTLKYRVSLAETKIRASDAFADETFLSYMKRRKNAGSEISRAGRASQVTDVISEAQAPDERKLPIALNQASASRRYDQSYLDLLDELTSRIQVLVDKKSSLVSVTAKMPDAVAAASLADAAAEQLRKDVMSFDLQRIDDQLRFVENEYNKSLERYNNAQQRLASFVDNNRIQATATSQLKKEGLQREVDLTFELVQQFAKEREQLRIKRSQNMPIFTIFEPAVVPNRNSSPRTARNLFLSSLVGMALGFFYALLRELRHHAGSVDRRVAQ